MSSYHLSHRAAFQRRLASHCVQYPALQKMKWEKLMARTQQATGGQQMQKLKFPEAFCEMERLEQGRLKSLGEELYRREQRDVGREGPMGLPIWQVSEKTWKGPCHLHHCLVGGAEC